MATTTPLLAVSRSLLPRSTPSFPSLFSPVRLPSATATATRVPAAGSPMSGEAEKEDPLVQYVVLRRDLIEQWPLGSVVAQGCHAAVAAVWSHLDNPETSAYCSPSNLDSMRKVTVEVKGEEQMRSLSESLTAGGIGHKMWVEQPEDIPTCIATRPSRKSHLAPFFRKLKLCK